MTFSLIVSEMQYLEHQGLLKEEYSAKILLATMRKPRAAFELSDKFGIPIAVCFRRIKQLEDSGLIVCAERRLTQEGKRVSLFKSNVDNAEVVLERNEVRAQVEIFDGSIQEVRCEIDMPRFLMGMNRSV
jgi:hypothetical protein